MFSSTSRLRNTPERFLFTSVEGIDDVFQLRVWMESENLSVRVTKKVHASKQQNLEKATPLPDAVCL
ncbi:hypothetical protein Y032_0438g1470 [Ancylostoma ceylanicum]|nr:hypothetical protein Y032_0438g1470 [Ancylostoma ceylanicum]